MHILFLLFFLPPIAPISHIQEAGWFFPPLSALFFAVIQGEAVAKVMEQRNNSILLCNATEEKPFVCKLKVEKVRYGCGLLIIDN